MYQVRSSEKRLWRNTSAEGLPNSSSRCRKMLPDRIGSRFCFTIDVRRDPKNATQTFPFRSGEKRRWRKTLGVLQKARSCHRLQEGTLLSLFPAQGPACKAPRKCILLRLSEKETTAFSTLTQHGICTKIIYHEITLSLKTCY